MFASPPLAKLSIARRANAFSTAWWIERGAWAFKTSVSLTTTWAVPRLAWSTVPGFNVWWRKYAQAKLGSPQEFVEGGILRGFRDFLKSDVFGVGHGHTLRFQ
jgi:hypothetical protein